MNSSWSWLEKEQSRSRRVSNLKLGSSKHTLKNSLFRQSSLFNLYSKGKMQISTQLKFCWGLQVLTAPNGQVTLTTQSLALSFKIIFTNWASIIFGYWQNLLYFCASFIIYAKIGRVTNKTFFCLQIFQEIRFSSLARFFTVTVQ